MHVYVCRVQRMRIENDRRQQLPPALYSGIDWATFQALHGWAISE